VITNKTNTTVTQARFVKHPIDSGANKPDEMDITKVEAIFPATPLQEARLKRGQNEAEAGRGRRLSCKLTGHLDLSAFEAAWRSVIQKYLVLRSSFAWKRLKKPVQLARRQVGFALTFEDWRGRSAEERLIRDQSLTERHWEFNLAEAPLLRVTVCQDGDQDYSLIWDYHPLILDQWSLQLILRDVLSFYSHIQFSCGKAPGADVHYRKYREWLKRRSSVEVEEYWRQETLENHGPAFVDAERHKENNHGRTQPTEARIYMPPQLSAEISEFTSKYRLKNETLIAGLWALLLGRYANISEVVIGIRLSGRSGEADSLADVVGPLGNTLPLRIQLAPETAVKDWLIGLQLKLDTLEQFADTSCEQLRSWRGLDEGAPLYEGVIEYERAKLPDPFPDQGSGVRLHSIQDYREYSDPLTIRGLFIEAVGITIHYDPSHYDAAVVSPMLEYLRTLLENIITRPDSTISELNRVFDIELLGRVNQWNQRRREYPREKSLQELYQEEAETRADEVALVDGDAAFSFGELNRRANHLAHYLIQKGIGPESVVGLMTRRGVEMIVGMLGIIKAGGAYLPLDSSYPLERLDYMLRDCEASVVVCEGWLWGELEKKRERVGGEQTVRLDEDWEEISKTSGGDPEPRAKGENLAYVIYTSGSTGKAKGVMVEQRGVMRLVKNADYAELGPGTVIAQGANASFDATTFEVWGGLLNGGRVAILEGEVMLSARRLKEAVREQRVNVMFVTTALFNQLVREDAGVFRELDQVFFGGEAVDARRVREVLKNGKPRRLGHVYGPTENTTFSTWEEVREVEEAAKRVPIGRAVSNTEVYVLGEDMEPRPAGARGELYAGGDGLARGYRGDAVQTAEKLVPHPYGKAGSRLYRTGDEVRMLSGGEVEFIGRNDGQVKLRGYRIEVGEIEARLAEYSEIEDAVVIAGEDGSGSRRLIAYYTGGEIRAEGLRSHLARSLPDYMTPTVYVRLERLPLTPGGKVDRRALPEPEGDAYLRRGYEAPEGETERKLAQIWADVLKLEQVGRNDNFFELGGHSLLVITLIERMSREGMQADVRTVFTAPTLRELAEAVRGSDEIKLETPPSLIPEGCERITPEMLPLIELTQAEIDAVAARTPGGAANVQDIYPLTSLQEGILFHYLLKTDGDPYLGQGLYSFDSRNRLDGFLQALQSVIDRHDILRTAVAWEALSEPAQVVWRKAPLIIEEIDCDPAAGDVAKQLIARCSPRHNRLDIRQAPMLRVYIAPAERREDASESPWLMCLLSHHLTVDHLTMAILSEEVEAHLLSRAERLPEPLPFRNFVARARLGVDREEHEEFFRKMLADVNEPTAPYGLIKWQGDGSDIGGASREVDEELSRRLRLSARALGVSVASLCHVAWAQALARFSGRNDVVFGTVLFGRMQGNTGSDRAVGLFINTLPIRIVIGEEGVERSVRRTHGLLADLMKREHASLALAQRCSGVAAPTPLFGSLFNYRHAAHDRRAAQDVAPSLEKASAWRGIKRLKDAGATNYPLTLSMDDYGDGLTLSAQVVVGIDPVGVCDYMITALEGLLEALERAPETALKAIDVMPEAERRQVVEAWNATEAAYPKENLIHELFEEQVERNPHAVALVYEEQSLTYNELNARANRLAWRLRELGVGPEARVAICLERSPEMVVALLAALKAGAAYVPLDPAYPSERLAYMLEDSEPAVLITQAAIRSALAERLPAIPTLDLESDETQWIGQSERNLERSAAGSDARSLAYIIYTSGSTGAPKGVMVEHANVVRLMKSTESWFGFGPDDVWTLFHSYAFDFSVWELWGALAYGGRLIIVPQAIRLSPEEFHDLLRRARVTVLNQTPSAFRQLISAGNGKAETHNLRYVIFGGEALDVGMLEPWYERNEDQPAQLVNMYGITETTVHVTYRLLEPSDTKRNGGSPIGRRIPDLKTYILDAHSRPAPIGVGGELHIGGAGVARGYLNRPELTAERFRPDSYGYEAGARMYRTGDLGRWASEGEMEFLGRNDSQVKIRGYRIELGEVENVMRSHAGVRDAVVVLREEEGGEKKLVGYVMLEGGKNATLAEVQSYLRERLPDYMAPSALIQLEQIPLNANGKLDRDALPAPEKENFGLTNRHLEPRDLLEILITQIWEEVLDVRPIGVKDHFFDLGGHSLLAVILLSRVQQITQIELPLTALFMEPTVEKLAGLLRQRQVQISDSPLVKFKENVTEQPFFCVHAVGGTVISYMSLARHLGENQPFYSFQSRGINGEPLPPLDIESMAADYIDQMLLAQPEGPYNLGGWSMGGVVAFEMARQLRLKGKEVSLLAIFDAAAPSLNATVRSYGEIEAILGFAQTLQLPIHKLVVSAEQLSELTMDELLAFLLEKAKEAEIMPMDIGLSDIKRYYEVFKANLNALASYRPQRGGGKLVLFRAAEQSLDHLKDSMMGWDSLVDDVEVIDVPGDHYSMLREPHSRVVAQELLTRLNSAEENYENAILGNV
jgi:amino acid adenylation domain-containing protein